MHILEALVAFALAMLVFSTTVSALVEAIYHRLFHLRQAGFRLLVSQIYDEVLVKNLKIAADKEAFLNSMVAHNGVPREGLIGSLGARFAGLFEAPVEKRIRGFFSGIEALLLPRKVAEMSTVEFVERLAATDAGKAIAAQGKAQLAIVVEDIALKFERYGRSATQYFAGRAQLVTLAVSILIAFGANIDADRLFQGFLKDPALREKLISRSDQIVAKYEAQQAQTVAAIAKLAALGPEAAIDAQAVESQKKLLQAELEALKKALDAAKSEIGEAKDLGLAIGTGYFPWCSIEPFAGDTDVAEKSGLKIFKFKSGSEAEKAYRPTVVDLRCKSSQIGLDTAIKKCLAEEQVQSDGTRTFMPVETCVSREGPSLKGVWARLGSPGSDTWSWFAMVLAAGLMIGLGGPFWFNVFSSLNGVLQVARAVGGVLRPKTSEGETQDSKASAAPGASQPKSVVDAFERAAQANNLTIGFGRIELTPSGDPR